MTDFHPWQSRPKRHDWRGWLVAAVAVIALVVAMTLVWGHGAEGASVPPRPSTDKVLPVPIGRHEMRLYCRNFAYRPAMSAECRRIGGYR